MRFQKTLLSGAVVAALGLGASTAGAVGVISWTLGDVGNDGTTSDFNFVSQPNGSSPNAFAAPGEVCPGGPCVDIAFNPGGQPIQTFTTGFNFGGGGDFEPFVSGSMIADIDPVLAAAGDGQALQFSALDFAGTYQRLVSPPGSTFLLGPDHLQNCTGAAAGLLGDTCGTVGTAGTNPLLGNPLGYNVQISDLGGGDFGVIVDFAATITEAGGFLGNEAHWRLEGTMHTTAVPVPAAAWLFGSGLMGLVGVARRRRKS